ncbi:esterase [Roseobacter cerasinus]|uniref:Esterase n=1 Tax=Roseobacter cerasinus TaxID=2602289 RepID=A0A640VZT9_9RHOB|nr:PaaI family thioesterase [Roseobacter cerasinus]GFE52435.1 esterase [Roseobacter cerasinus]
MTGPDIIVGESPIQRLLGFVVDISDKGGSARCFLDIRDDHINRNGVVHGGIITTLLDCAGGFTAGLATDGDGSVPCLTISLNVQFMAPAISGRVTASAKRRGGGRKLHFLDMQLTDENGRVLATAQGVFKPASRPTPDERPTQ